MREKLRKILITGGAGFIGSAFVREALSDGRYEVVVVDKLTYAGDLERLKDLKKKYKYFKLDICDKKKLGAVFAKEKPQAVINFAAETHVDRSILSAGEFIRTNIIGTQALLDLSRKYEIEKYIQISSDEVYGDTLEGRFREDSPLAPNSPYAASKAAADLLIRAYIRTYDFPAIIIRPCNNYGPWQYPEKYIPLAVLKLLRNEKIPVYGKGINVREWLYVDECAKGMLEILKKGKVGEIYNLGSDQERKNIEVAELILRIFGVSKNMIEFVKDRPGHDLRYRLDSSKVRRQTGWQATFKFEDGLNKTISWCKEHNDWLSGKWKEIARLYNFK